MFRNKMVPPSGVSLRWLLLPFDTFRDSRVWGFRSPLGLLGLPRARPVLVPCMLLSLFSAPKVISVHSFLLASAWDFIFARFFQPQSCFELGGAPSFGFFTLPSERRGFFIAVPLLFFQSLFCRFASFPSPFETLEPFNGEDFAPLI